MLLHCCGTMMLVPRHIRSQIFTLPVPITLSLIPRMLLLAGEIVTWIVCKLLTILSTIPPPLVTSSSAATQPPLALILKLLLTYGVWTCPTHRRTIICLFAQLAVLLCHQSADLLAQCWLICMPLLYSGKMIMNFRMKIIQVTFIFHLLMCIQQLWPCILNF